MYKSKFNSAFTMIELLFVIVILGIVSSIASSIITQVYEGYIIQRATHITSIKTELAATQIANHLSFRIHGLTIGRKDSSTFLPVTQIDPSKTDYSILEWIEYDHDTFGAIENTANRLPVWSGYCDVENSSHTSLNTPASNLSYLSTILGYFGNTISDMNIFFQGREFNSTLSYNSFCTGYKGSNTHCTIPVSGIVGDTGITISPTSPTYLTEQYKLIRSAYAIVPINHHGNLYDLELRYNFQPWNSIHYDHASTKKSLLITDVSTFKFSNVGGTLRFKICAQENIGLDYNVSICKEKAILQ